MRKISIHLIEVPKVESRKSQEKTRFEETIVTNFQNSQISHILISTITICSKNSK